MIKWLMIRRKTIVAMIGAVAVVGVALAPTSKWVAVVVAIATALGVYGVPNQRAVTAKAPPAAVGRVTVEAIREFEKRSAGATGPVPGEWMIRRRRIPEQVIPGKRLGRHVHRDSRSAAYPYQRKAAQLQAVLHQRRIPILDQGNVGSCTGNAETGCLGSDPFYGFLAAGTVLDESEALALYAAAERIDGGPGYPPQDDGSSGTSICQAALNAGLISGYMHAATVDDMAGALQEQPVIIGVNWYDSFDHLDVDGMIVISPGAQVRGGHEVLVRGVDPAARTFWCDNSWGTGWGTGGSFGLSWDTMARLLAEDGDCTVPVPATQPPPVPVTGTA